MSAAAGRKFFGVEESHEDLISSDRVTAITARVHMDYPGAAVLPRDGYYIIRFPADAYMDKQYEVKVDNKTGRVR